MGQASDSWFMETIIFNFCQRHTACLRLNMVTQKITETWIAGIGVPCKLRINCFMTGLSISQPSLSAVSVLCGWQACILLSGETRVMSGRSSHALHALNACAKKWMPKCWVQYKCWQTPRYTVVFVFNSAFVYKWNDNLSSSDQCYGWWLLQVLPRAKQLAHASLHWSN